MIRRTLDTNADPIQQINREQKGPREMDKRNDKTDMDDKLEPMGFKEYTGAQNYCYKEGSDNSTIRRQSTQHTQHRALTLAQGLDEKPRLPKPRNTSTFNDSIWFMARSQELGNGWGCRDV